MVLPVPAYRIDDNHFAIEGAFADHVRLLRSKLGPLGSNFVIACPAFSIGTYQLIKSQLAVISESVEGIRFVPMYPVDTGRLGYLRKLPGVMLALYREVQKAAVVHSGISGLYRPF